MIRFPREKHFSTYIIETYDYASVKREIQDFAISIGFEKELVNNLTHPDLCFLESNGERIKIDVIREEIIDNMRYTPKIADKKIYVIYDAADLDEYTQDSLLKTLEEPPEYDIIILVTQNVNKLLETVRSRAVILRDTDDMSYKDLLDYPYTDDALKILANVKYVSESELMAFAENFSKPNEDFDKLVKIYRYALRDALYYKMTLSKDSIEMKEKETYIISMANSFTYEELGKFVDNLDRLLKMKMYTNNYCLAVYNFFNIR